MRSTWVLVSWFLIGFCLAILIRNYSHEAHAQQIAPPGTWVPLPEEFHCADIACLDGRQQAIIHDMNVLHLDQDGVRVGVQQANIAAQAANATASQTRDDFHRLQGNVADPVTTVYCKLFKGCNPAQLGDWGYLLRQAK